MKYGKPRPPLSDDAEFFAAQDALMKAGKPDDPCGRCGCKRKAHKAVRKETGFREKRLQANAKMITTLAPTCCNKCDFCICSCTAFMEPYAGQQFDKCVYDTLKDA